jgi:hypothetical protein
MNRDFNDMLSALSAGGVEFLVVGAHALAAHGRDGNPNSEPEFRWRASGAGGSWGP